MPTTIFGLGDSLDIVAAHTGIPLSITCKELRECDATQVAKAAISEQSEIAKLFPEDRSKWTNTDVKNVYASLKRQMTDEQFRCIREKHTGMVPFSMLIEMQEFVQPKQDEALLALWGEIAPEEMRGVRDLNEIRTWMANPENQAFLQSITAVDMRHKNLEAIPREIQYLSQLQELRLAHNPIKDIPSEIGNLTQLQCLDLGCTLIQVIPPEIQHLSQLQGLHLDHNQIQAIPREIRHLTQLQALHLDHNQIQKIPREIEHLTQLRWLHLDHNQIQEIPPEIGSLNPLIHLHLDNNKIRDIPPEIGNLTHLEVLHIDENQIEVIPPEFCHLIQLRELSIDNRVRASSPEVSQFLDQIELLNRNPVNYRGISSMITAIIVALTIVVIHANIDQIIQYFTP